MAGELPKRVNKYLKEIQAGPLGLIFPRKSREGQKAEEIGIHSNSGSPNCYQCPAQQRPQSRSTAFA